MADRPLDRNCPRPLVPTTIGESPTKLYPATEATYSSHIAPSKVPAAAKAAPPGPAVQPTADAALRRVAAAESTTAALLSAAARPVQTGQENLFPGSLAGSTAKAETGPIAPIPAAAALKERPYHYASASPPARLAPQTSRSRSGAAAAATAAASSASQRRRDAALLTMQKQLSTLQFELEASQRRERERGAALEQQGLQHRRQLLEAQASQPWSRHVPLAACAFATPPI
jgi:hypothetical protein